MKIVAVIPARYKSSRFPGKPLIDLCGKPMIWWVYNQCLKVKEFSSVIVATDSEIIEEACKSYNINVMMTSKNHQTGTDRVGEISERIEADLFVNVQGDEPLLEPETIKAAITPFYDDPKLQVSNLMTKITNPVDVVNFTVPKVITNQENVGIFLTRSSCPYPKGSISYTFYKQVCVYGFTPKALKFFCDYGKQFGKAKIEAVEDIEILRFIENGYKVQYVEVNSNTVAVDTPNDAEKVRNIIKQEIE